MLCIHGDASAELTIENSHIKYASGVAVVLNNDQDTLFVTMSMKTINPDLFILNRCSQEKNQIKLKRAGANKVINPYTSGGHRMAAILARPQVEDSISVISPKHADMKLTLDEISLRGVFKYQNKNIKDSKIWEDCGISIVGIIKKNGETMINPLSDTKLSASDKVLLIGDNDKMDSFKKKLPKY